MPLPRTQVEALHALFKRVLMPYDYMGYRQFRRRVQQKHPGYKEGTLVIPIGGINYIINIKGDISYDH
jgi:hypothetical protein